MSDGLRDFLIRIAHDQGLISVFNRVSDVLDHSGLTAEEQAAFLSRDSTRIYRMLGDDERDIINMIFHWFKPGSMA